MLIQEEHTVESLANPIRLSDYVPGKFASRPSRSGMKKAIRKNLLLVDGIVGKTGTFLTGGETLHLLRDTPATPARAFHLDIPILYEDEDLAVINKPAGVEVSGNKFKTVENALRQHLTPSSRADYLDMAQAVHRIDYATSGILIIGKTSSAVSHLNQQFEHRTVSKQYVAIVIGEIAEEGSIREKVDEKPSMSHYRKLRSQISTRFGQLTLVELIPETGRRHQLRKHLLSIGHPILGDKLYFLSDMIFRGRGMFLHARSVSFDHPVTGKRMEFTAPLPNKYLRIFPDLNL